jgi:hypothetical protein
LQPKGNQRAKQHQRRQVQLDGLMRLVAIAPFPRIPGQIAPWKTKKGTERFFASLSPLLVNRCFYPAIPL